MTALGDPCLIVSGPAGDPCFFYRMNQLKPVALMQPDALCPYTHISRLYCLDGFPHENDTIFTGFKTPLNKRPVKSRGLEPFPFVSAANVNKIQGLGPCGGTYLRQIAVAKGIKGVVLKRDMRAFRAARSRLITGIISAMQERFSDLRSGILSASQIASLKRWHCRTEDHDG